MSPTQKLERVRALNHAVQALALADISAGIRTLTNASRPCDSPRAGSNLSLMVRAFGWDVRKALGTDALRRPHPVLVATSLGALALALALALGPFAAVLGFAPLPGMLLAALFGLVVLYLAAAEVLKRVAVPRAATRQRL